MKTLNQLRDEAHANAIRHGFYDVERDGYHDYGEEVKRALFAQKIALIHAELSEALEADRSDRRADLESFEAMARDGKLPEDGFAYYVKNTVEDELADVLIRTLDLCGYLGVDIQRHVALKMRYNQRRPYRHGKSY